MQCFAEDAENRLEGVKEEEPEEQDDAKDDMATLKPNINYDTKSSSDYTHSLSEGLISHNPIIEKNQIFE